MEQSIKLFFFKLPKTDHICYYSAFNSSEITSLEQFLSTDLYTAQVELDLRVLYRLCTRFSCLGTDSI
jgi:hypothetical protein